jgi:hypothetical protein
MLKFSLRFRVMTLCSVLKFSPRFRIVALCSVLKFSLRFRVVTVECAEIQPAFQDCDIM